jgi:DNA-binding LytR/AlgR family response regulator
MNIRTLIIEDEAPAFRRLDNLLKSRDEDFEIIDVIDSVTDSIKWLQNHAAPDLIFSDIQLSDGLSFDIYKEVEIDCPIIFTTAYDEYMMNAFETNGIDYLLKPIQEESLNRSIEKFKKFGKSQNVQNPQESLAELIQTIEQSNATYKKRFLIKLGDKLIPIKTEDVAYFCYRDGTTELIHRSGKTYIADQPLDELEKVLNPLQFFRLNRQFLASEDAIGTIHKYFQSKLKVELHPTPEEKVLVSREKSSRFKAWLDGREV